MKIHTHCSLRLNLGREPEPYRKMMMVRVKKINLKDRIPLVYFLNHNSMKVLQLILKFHQSREVNKMTLKRMMKAHKHSEDHLVARIAEKIENDIDNRNN